MASISGASLRPVATSTDQQTAHKSVKPRVRVKAVSSPQPKFAVIDRSKAKLLDSASAIAVGQSAALGVTVNPGSTGAAVALGDYPKVPRGSHVDTYFGVKVADPYRQLEDDPKAAAKFDKAQMAITRPYLDALPTRSAFADLLKKLYQSSDTGPNRPIGKDFLFSKRQGGEDQAVLYFRSGSDGSTRVLFDPNKEDVSKDGTLTIGGLSVSPDNKRIALGLSDNGSDWVTWYVQDVATGAKADVIRWTKTASVEWLPDGSGFYYSALPEPKKGREYLEVVHDNVIKLHMLGTDQSADKVVFTPAKSTTTADITVDKDAKLEVVQTGELLTGASEVLVRPLGHPKAKFKSVFAYNDANFQLMDVIDATHLRFLTDRDSPHRRVIEMDISQNPPVMKEVLPEDKEAVLQSAQFIGDRVYANYLLQGSSVLRVFLNGQLEKTVQMPDRGTVTSFFGDKDGTTATFSMTNVYMPSTEFTVDLATGKRSVSKLPEIPVNSGDYVTEEEWFKSTDGTMVPMWITRRRDSERNGETPTLLYAYGGFDNNVTPSYSRRWQAWLDAGGVVAIPQLRGGGELGETWHTMGEQSSKQNVFEDFKSAAKHLFAQKITNPSKLTIAGASNGGYLMGAMATQAPDLFACILADVGVQDQLRYPLYTWGPGWVPEYGDAANDERAFKNLIGLSPVHNVRKGVKYPAIMVSTSTHDDRVAPMHSRKFTAALQWAQGANNPIVYRIDQNCGHGAGKPVTKLTNALADQMAFAFHAMGCDDYAEKLKARLA